MDERQKVVFVLTVYYALFYAIYTGVPVEV